MWSSMSSTTSTLSSQPTSTTTTIQPRPRPRPLKKANKPITPPHVEITSAAIIVAEVDSSDGSSLTPISSPIEIRSAQAFPRMSPEFELVASSSGTKKPQGRSQLKPEPSSSDTWDLSKLGTLVWVLIDQRARVLEPDDLEDIESQNKDRIWWPGKIISTTSASTPLRVSLANHVGFGKEAIEISQPCESNIISWKNHKGDMRFDEPVFTNPASFGSMLASPRKKQKVDRDELKDRWRVAVDELNGVRTKSAASPKKTSVSPKKTTASPSKETEVQRPTYLSETDGYESDLPEVGTEEFRAYPPSAPSSPAKPATPSQKRKAKRKRSPEDDSIEQMEWPPSGPDPFVKVPGELVLAIERNGDTKYWPARVLEYIPAAKGTKTDKYLVEYLDGTSKAISRSWFFIPEDDGFVTCQLGDWESTITEVQDDDDDDDDTNQRNNGRQRSPSPIPTIPPPTANDFRLLEMREQLAYTKPILSAVLIENFPPAMRRHTAFIAGGSKRKNIVDEASLRGQMDPNDIVTLQRCVMEWCLRDEQRAEAIMDEEDIPTSSHQNIVMDLGDDTFGPSALSATRPASPTVSEATEIFSEASLPPMSSFATSEVRDSVHLRTPLISSFTRQGTPSIAQLDMFSSALPRQYGCEAFEALSRVEKADYCLNVLVPEAILQILLWRNGDRTSIDILDDEEEADLYAKGVILLKASDWVNDVMRLRMAAIGEVGKTRKSAGGKGPDIEEMRYTDRGRPRRTAASRKSYLEA
ncbi:hypothetical protein DXG01_012102 [Tephrocybe rancida]|nr:hypothetical protein DXG01_012102 [Tephrocybe rancida]